MTDEYEELPRINWRAHVSPSMDRREQLRLYQEAIGAAAARRQVELRREELARARAKPKPGPKP